MSDVIRILREVHIRKEAQFSYARAYDRMSDLEQTETGKGHPALAAENHARALICLKAYKAELEDPEPTHDDHDRREGWR